MSKVYNRGISIIIIIWVILISYILCRLLGQPDGTAWPIKLAMGIFIAVPICQTVRDKKRDNLKYEDLVHRIIFMGIVMRIGYMLYTGCIVRSHDLGELSYDYSGHAGYLLCIIENCTLPGTNSGQFYQQPLFYLTGGFVSRCINAVLGSGNAMDLVDAAKTVSCAASCISLLVAERIMVFCGLRDRGLAIAMTLMAFLPGFYLAGGRINPDMLAFMFMMLAVLYTLRWIRNPDWKNTIILALIYGFGMMTKISCGIIAVVTAIVFVLKLIEAAKERRLLPLAKKYAVFSAVSLSLGLWYSVRNYIAFGQSLNYVLLIDRNSDIYTGNYSIFQRLIGIDIRNLISTPYAHPFDDYNFPVYSLKSSLFGEFTYDVGNIIPSVLLCIAAILSAFFVIALVKILRDKEISFYQKFFCILAIWLYVSGLWFYYNYPFGCSMDYRYLLILTLPAAVILGSCSSFSEKSRYCLNVLLGGFGIMSCMMYCVI